jgi:hypothetical protein
MLNVAETFLFSGTFVAPFAGIVKITVGAVIVVVDVAAPWSLSHPTVIMTRSNASDHIIALNVLLLRVPVRIYMSSFYRFAQYSS